MTARSIVAGIDVGNSTTEVVLVDAHTREPLAWDRAPTRGVKGSSQSLDTAAGLLNRVMRRSGHVVDQVSVAPLHPVRTAAVVIPDTVRPTGRLRAGPGGSDTVGVAGVGFGTPCSLDGDPPRDVDVVALVPGRFGYAAAARGVNGWLADGVSVVAVVCADDEAVLVSNRLDTPIPVVDRMNVLDLGPGRVERLAVEVARLGQPLTRITDPLWLVSCLRLGDGERGDAVSAAGRLVDSRAGVVAVSRADPGAEPQEPEPQSWVEWANGRRSSFRDAHPRLRRGPPGEALAYWVAGDDRSPHPVADLVTLRLADVGGAAMSRQGSVADQAYVLSSLGRRSPVSDPAPELAQRTGLRVVATIDEADAARRGALTTPGAPASAAVLDLGGGTIDLVVGGSSVIGAGAGELLTVSVAELLGIPRGAAEWAKRGPGLHVDSPHVVVAEDGSRSFAHLPPPPDALGSVVVSGPVGWLVVSSQLSGSEWRVLRLAVKHEVLGGGVRRLLAAGLDLPSALVVVGGPAGDDETVRVLGDVLAAGMAVGRGAVAGVLGHRHAVAHGLALAAIDG